MSQTNVKKTQTSVKKNKHVKKVIKSHKLVKEKDTNL